MGRWIIAFLLASPLLISAGFSVNNLLFLSKAESAMGTVVDFKTTTTYNSRENRYEGTPNMPRTSSYPVVTFKTTEGKEIKFSSTAGFTYVMDSWGPYNLGTPVKVAYRPNNPYDAAINDIYSLWSIPFVAGVMGLIVWSPLLLGLIGKWFYYHKMHKEDPLNFP